MGAGKGEDGCLRFPTEIGATAPEAARSGVWEVRVVWGVCVCVCKALATFPPPSLSPLTALHLRTSWELGGGYIRQSSVYFSFFPVLLRHN